MYLDNIRVYSCGLAGSVCNGVMVCVLFPCRRLVRVRGCWLMQRCALVACSGSVCIAACVMHVRAAVAAAATGGHSGSTPHPGAPSCGRTRELLIAKSAAELCCELLIAPSSIPANNRLIAPSGGQTYARCTARILSVQRWQTVPLLAAPSH